MTPKRKRDGDPETPAGTSSRATRASTRTTAVGNKTSTQKEGVVAAASTSKSRGARAGLEGVKSSTVKASATANANPVQNESEMPTAKRTTKSKTPRASKASKATPKEASTGSGKGVTKQTPQKSYPPPPSKPTENAPASPTQPTTKVEPYSSKRTLALFKQYADSDDPDVIGPEGFTRLCTDAGIPMEGALPLVLAWIMGAKEMGKLTKAEWVEGTGEFRIASLPQILLATKDLESLLILGGQPLKRPSTGQEKKGADAGEPYDRSKYWMYVTDRKAAFLKLYSFCFALAKPAQARNIDMETATAFWNVLLRPQYTIISEVIEFIDEKGAYKGANKDLWNMMLEFCQTVKPSLEDYEADGAWPTLFDDFAAWKKSKTQPMQSDAPTADT